MPSGVKSKTAPSNKTPHQKRVEEFMRKAEQDVPSKPQIPGESTCYLRAKLILEETLETLDALGYKIGFDKIPHRDEIFFFPALNGKTPDIVQVVDGCCDISVVTVGTLSAFGVSDLPMLQAVDESNLAKFTGDAHKDENGKWIKPSDWKAPDIPTLLATQGYKPTV